MAGMGRLQPEPQFGPRPVRGVIVLVGRTSASFGYNAGIFLPLAVVVSIAYLILGMAYWFRTPIIGIGVCVFLFSAAWVLHLVGRQ